MCVWLCVRPPLRAPHSPPGFCILLGWGGHRRGWAGVVGQRGCPTEEGIAAGRSGSLGLRGILFFWGGALPPPTGPALAPIRAELAKIPHTHTPRPLRAFPRFPRTPPTQTGQALPCLGSPPPEMNWIKPGEAPPLRTDSASPAAGRCGQLPAEPGEQDRQQHGLWFPFGPPAGHVSSSEGCRWVLAPPPRPTVLTRCLTGVTQGMPKAAGSAPSSCTRWIPARTHIPTSSPRRRPVTSTKFSVSGPEGRKGAGGEHRGGAPCRAGPPSPVGTPPPPQLLCLGSCSHPRASAPTPAAPLSSPRSSQREAGVPGCLQQPDVSPAAC